MGLKAQGASSRVQSLSRRSGKLFDSDRVLGIKFDGVGEGSFSLFIPAQATKGDAELDVSFGVAGIYFQGLAELGLGLFQLVEFQEDFAVLAVGVGISWGHSEGLFIFLGRFLEHSLLGEVLGDFEVSLSVLGGGGAEGGEISDSPSAVSLFVALEGEAVAVIFDSGIQFDSSLEAGESAFVGPRLILKDAVEENGIDVVGVSFKGFLELLPCF